MTFAAAIRNRNSERVIAIVSVVAVLLSMMVVFANTARATYPTTVAYETCEDDVLRIAYTSTSWSTAGPPGSGSGHPNVAIQVSVEGGAWTTVASGAYTEANGYTFSGTFTGDYQGKSIAVRSYASGPWDNGEIGGNSHSSATTPAFIVSEDCGSSPTGKIIVEKLVSEGDQSLEFDFTASFDLNGFQLTHGGQDPTGDLPIGEHWVTEDVPDGWELVDSYCDDDNSTPDAINLEADETVTCTFVNREVPPPPSGWACVGGEVVFIEDATGFEGTLYETEEEAANDPECQEVAASTTFTIGGACDLGEAGAAFTISGNLGEGLTLTVAGQTVDSTGAFSIAVGGAGSYDYEVTLDEGFVLAEGSPSSEGSIVIEDCTPPPPPSGWVCEAGEAVFLADTTGFEGTVYDTQGEALEDPECQEVAASTTFTIGGACALVGDEASFTISGSLGEGLTLTVAGQTVTTSPFSIDVATAGSYPYTVTLDEGFELAVGSPAAAGTILIPDCSSDDEVDDVDELPFTGIDTGALSAASLVLLGTGTALLMSARRREET